MGKRSTTWRWIKRTSISLTHFVGWNLVILIACGLAIFAFGDKISSWFVDAHYAHVEKPNSGKIPPTFTTFLPGPSVAAVIGGRGQGLDCSIPAYASFAFEKSGRVEAPLELRFRQACVMHDLCYRHGLATYGYTQTDCDYMLQEQTYQICASYLAGGLERCQRSAKKVLLGVRIGGAGSFQGAESSTYFEYDPFPVRVPEFVFARAMRSPGRGKETLVTFRAKQAGIAATEAGGTGRPVWLPQRYFMAAPHHAIDADGYSKLVWSMRNDTESTLSCLVRRTLDTLYLNPNEGNGLFLCNTPDLQSLVNLRSTSPVVVSKPSAKLVTASVTSFQSTSAKRQDADVIELQSLDVKWRDLGYEKPTNLYRFLQSAFITGRFVSAAGAGDMLIFRRGLPAGAGYRDKADAVVVASDHVQADPLVLAAAGGEKPKRPAHVFSSLPIPEEIEPLGRLPAGTAVDGFLAVSAATCSGTANCLWRAVKTWSGFARPRLCRLYGACFLSMKLDGAPAREVPINAGGKIVEAIDPSFVARPVLVAQGAAKPDPEVFISRARLDGHECIPSEKDKKCYDIVRLEAIALKPSRKAGALSLGFDRGAVCKIKRALFVEQQQSCKLSLSGKSQRQLLWANRLRGGQAVVGDFAGSAELDFALIDPCYLSEPVILETASSWYGTPDTLDVRDGLKPEASCTALSGEDGAALLAYRPE